MLMDLETVYFLFVRESLSNELYDFVYKNMFIVM